MPGQFHGRMHSPWGTIHTTVESAFLTAGLVLSTLVTLLAVCAAIWMMDR